jgi:SAM-dependent methyltransferase
VSARADLAPFPDASFDLVVVEDISQTGSPPDRVLDEARRLCRPTGTVLVGFRSGLERLRRRLPASLRSPPAIVLVALPTLRRPAFLLRASDRDAARYFVRRIALAYREPGDAGVRARLQQTRSQAALLAPATLALHGAPGRLAVLPGPEMPPSQLEAVGNLVLGSWTALELPGRPPNRLAPLVVATVVRPPGW